MEVLEARGECCEVESSGYGIAIILVSSQKRWFSAKGLYHQHKVHAAEVLVWTGKEILSPSA